MYRLLIIGLIIFISGCLPNNIIVNNVDKNETRAFIATRLAKSSMALPATPAVDNDEELCDGSGFITHGDGHRTKCPGCKACQKKNEYSETATQIIEDKEPLYYMYYFSADWCEPCQRMKNTTWKDEDLTKFLKEKRIKLIILKEEDSDKKEYFSFYEIKSMPATIILKPSDLENTIKRKNGFMDSASVKKFVEDL